MILDDSFTNDEVPDTMFRLRAAVKAALFVKFT